MTRLIGGRPLEPRVGSIADLAATFRGIAETAATEAIDSRGRFRFGIPGGSVATAFLPVVSTAAIAWHAVDLFWVDERIVPLASEESNAGVALRGLLGTQVIGTATLHRFPLGPPAPGWLDPLSGAVAAAPLDLVLLGVGEDGHVASLFADRALDCSATVVAVDDAPKPPARRLSLGLATICRARHVVIAAFGASKSTLVERLLREPASPLPVAVVLREAARVDLFLDHAAAGPMLGSDSPR